MGAMDKNYKINRFNEKLMKNLIAGSLFLGGSAIFTTQIQATQPVSGAVQNIHKYDQEATEKLRKLRFEIVTPLDERTRVECMRLIREEKADPNVEVGTLTLLEEAILRGLFGEVKILIKKGADVYKITNHDVDRDENGKVKNEYGRTLFHLAVYGPEKMQKLLNQYKEEKKEEYMSKHAKEWKGFPIKKDPNENFSNLSINKYISKQESRSTFSYPTRGILRELFDGGLGKKEMGMPERRNGLTPYVIAENYYKKIKKYIDRERTSGSKLPGKSWTGSYVSMKMLKNNMIKL
ncbi:MAG: hypothetical protein LBI77_00175, partial [Puniceicoccales bacterium]|jgi:hypothetical protein|nr:hypothetical protein [Puniceicoccales bacterium]